MRISSRFVGRYSVCSPEQAFQLPQMALDAKQALLV